MTRTEPFWHTTAALHTCQENVSVYILYQYVYNVMWNGWKVFLLDLRPLASFAQMISITTRPRPWPWAHHMHIVHVPSASDSSSAAKNTSLDLVRQNQTKPCCRQNQTKPCCSPHEATKHFKQVTFGTYLRQFSKSHWSENMRPRIIHHTISPQASKSRTNLVFCSLRKVQPLFFFHNTHQPSNLKLARK